MAATGGTILIVDGDATVRTAAARALKSTSYQVLEAASIAQARKMLAAPLRAIVVGEKLPDGTANQLLQGVTVPSIFLGPDTSPTDLPNILRRQAAARSQPPSRPQPPPLPLAEPTPVSSTPMSTAAGAEMVRRAMEEELSFLTRAGHYRVLEIANDASEGAVAEAYQKFRKKWLPTFLSEEATREIRDLASEILELGQTAFKVLSDKKARAAYTPPKTFLPKTKKRVDDSGSLPPDLFADLELPAAADEDPEVGEVRQLIRKGKTLEAKTKLDKLLTRKPASKPARALAQVAKAMGESDDSAAAAAIEEALVEDPDCAEALAAREALATRREQRLDGVLPQRVGRRQVIDAIGLAFANSGLKDVVGADALRMVLEPRYVELVATPGMLALQPLWDIVAGQPGFKPELALPPICRIKSWERDLGFQVVLPREAAQLGLIDQQNLAAQCRVSSEGLLRALEGTVAEAPRAAPMISAGTAGNIVVTGTETVAEQKKRGIAIYLFAAAVAIFTTSAVITLGGGSGPKSLSASEVTSDIPIDEVRRSGEVVGAVLTDSAWFGRSVEEREKAMEAALERIHAQGVAAFVLLDSKGSVLAQAVSEGAQVIVTFAR